MRVSDFDFELPERSIARYPAQERDASRLMVLRRDTGAVEHRRFAELPSLLAPGDLLVVNDTRVLPARLSARKKATGGKVEVLLIEPVQDDLHWRAMVTGSKSLRAGTPLAIDGVAGEAHVEAVEGEGFVIVALPEGGRALASRAGAIPLPPYLGRRAEPLDSERYQTVFSEPEKLGSVAAPTAGLHFTPAVLEALAARGIERAAITLTVGPGTFLPVRVEEVADHVMHSERFEVAEETAAKIAARKGRLVAVGTTVCRTLESMGDTVVAGPGATRLFITPGFRFRHVEVLLTNFHLPRSTLLMLVAAFAGREKVLAAYAEAVREGYRFFSYGDAMVIL